MNPRESVKAARELHQELLGGSLSKEERAKLTAAILDHLFAAESSKAFPNSCRLLFLRLRSDAEYCAGFER